MLAGMKLIGAKTKESAEDIQAWIGEFYWFPLL